MPALPPAPSPLPPPAALDLGATSLFLDIDGTLVAFAATPGEVGPAPARTELLRRLDVRLGGRMAAVSGRDMASMDRILDGAAPASAAVHGLERRTSDGAVHRLEPHPAVVEAVAAFLAFADAHPGALVEDKVLGATLHYRRAPAARDGAHDLAQALAQTHGLTLQDGDQMVELKTPGADKGSAVRAFMAEAPFRDGRPVFVGDDLTDEHGFEAAVALGGFGVLVGPPRATFARYGLTDVKAVLAWLEQSLAT